MDNPLYNARHLLESFDSAKRVTNHPKTQALLMRPYERDGHGPSRSSFDKRGWIIFFCFIQKIFANHHWDMPTPIMMSFDTRVGVASGEQTTLSGTPCCGQLGLAFLMPVASMNAMTQSAICVYTAEGISPPLFPCTG